MHLFLRKQLFILCFILACNTILAQQPPRFYNEIAEYKKSDSLHKPAANSILFIGSSSFRLWTNINSYFPGKPVINRGFGGSSLSDVIRYADDILFVYQPKQIVIYAGENDLATDMISPDSTFHLFRNLFELIRLRMPQVPVLYISIKPSPSRAHLMHLMVATNRRIQQYLREMKNARFIDVYKLMLNKNGKPRPELFLGDNLHMNEKGYAIWQKAIGPYLK